MEIKRKASIPSYGVVNPSTILTAERLAEAIRIIKKDDTPLKLYREFLAKSNDPIGNFKN